MIVEPTLQALMKDFGSEIGVGELILDEDGACALRIDDKLRVDFQYWPDREHLMIYVDLGVPEAGAEIYIELLRANLFWRMTFGATLSLSNDAPPHVVLAQTSDWRSLRASSLKEMVERFVNTAQDWKEMIHAPSEIGTSKADLPTSLDDMTVIRV
jgi:hypothetical protein